MNELKLLWLLQPIFFLCKQALWSKIIIIRKMFEDHGIRTRENKSMTQMFTGLGGMTYLYPQQIFACEVDGYSQQPARAALEEVLLLGRHNAID